jgi:predicted XRE-type DNA-binding protein
MLHGRGRGISSGAAGTRFARQLGRGERCRVASGSEHAEQTWPTISEQLRAAIAESELSSYRIAKGAGVPQPVVHRFASGKRKNIRLDTADKLAKFFGMRLMKGQN